MLLEPAAIVTVAGTTTAAVLLASVTAAPPVGAVPVSVMIPVTAVPPDTEVDDKTRLASAAVVGAVTAVELAHPDAARSAKRATPNVCLFTFPIVASKTRPRCDTHV